MMLSLGSTIFARKIIEITSLLLSLVSGFAMHAFADEANNFFPTDSIRFEKAYLTLRQESQLFSQNRTLRQMLQAIAAANQVTIWLDRRVDGEMPVANLTNRMSTLAVLDSLCQQSNTKVTWLENLVYLAPSDKAASIESEFWRLYQQYPELRKTISKIDWKTSITSHVAWDKFSSQTKVISIENVENKIPFDRWNNIPLESSTIAAQASVLLAGFDLTLDKSDNLWEIVPRHEQETSTLGTYRGLVASLGNEQLREWKSRWPSSKTLKLGDDHYQIEATPAAHRELKTLKLDRRAIPKAPTIARNRRYSLTVQGALGEKLPEIASQLGLTIDPWPIDANTMAQRIHVTVKDATLEEMFDAIGQASGLNLKPNAAKLQIESKSRNLPIIPRE